MDSFVDDRFWVWVVVGVGVAFMVGFFLLYKKRQTKKTRRNTLKSRALGALEVVEPQMGHPITQGVTGWQEFKPASKPVDGFEQIAEFIEKVRSAPPLHPQKTVDHDGDDPWARAVAEGLVHRRVPPSTHN